MASSVATRSFHSDRNRGNGEKVIVFTRYPEAGQVKTRLISVMGAAGAADLQREMTRHVIQQTEIATKARGAVLEIFFSGGTAADMEEMFGKNYSFRVQLGSDLGERLEHALAESFREGFHKVVVVGADCPSLTPAILAAALESLADHDLVLGPAVDGGYYLIGMTCFEQRLFQDIHWGTAEVCQQTLYKAQTLNMTIFQLDELKDVDRPEDLLHFNCFAGS